PDEGPGGQAGRRVGRAAGRRAAGRARLDGALHARGVRARRVRLRLRTPGQRRGPRRDPPPGPRPPSAGRPPPRPTEAPPGGRPAPRPDFTLFAGRARRARRKEYRRHNKELFRTADALVRARMHTCPLGPQTDLLSRLVSTPDPETGTFLDAETIRDQILMHLSNASTPPPITPPPLPPPLAPP